ncbi:MAG: hypothetical protein Q9167_002938 [Letrouitia subvulpina]
MAPKQLTFTIRNLRRGKICLKWLAQRYLNREIQKEMLDDSTGLRYIDGDVKIYSVETTKEHGVMYYLKPTGAYGPLSEENHILLHKCSSNVLNGGLITRKKAIEKAAVDLFLLAVHCHRKPSAVSTILDQLEYHKALCPLTHLRHIILGKMAPTPRDDPDDTKQGGTLGWKASLLVASSSRLFDARRYHQPQGKIFLYILLQKLPFLLNDYFNRKCTKSIGDVTA